MILYHKPFDMKSKANIKGHPIHPILIAFPLAFFIGALIFDILSLLLDNASLWQTGYYLAIAGIIGGLAAAIPGIIDYFYTVPPNSSGKKRATKHGLLNITIVVLFVIDVFYRQSDMANTTVVLIIEIVGMVLLFISGWLGGTLVYRNQIGVNPRYAHAGKWKETDIDSPDDRIEVATMDELKVDQMKLIRVNDKRIVLARDENGYVAFDDHCTHRGGSLAGGMMICGTVQCPWHGSQFDVHTGMVKAGPAEEKINTYTVEESNGKVYLIL